MPGVSVAWRIVAGAILVGLGILFGRRLGRRRDLLYLTGLRNGHTALAFGHTGAADLAAIQRLLAPDGLLVEIALEATGPVVDRSLGGGRPVTRLVCEPARLPFGPERFDAIILGDPRWVRVLVPLLKPAGVLSLIQVAGRGFRPAASRRRQLSEAGLEVIDSPGMGLSYVVNARRPIRTEAGE